MSHERIIKSTARRDEHTEMAESGFRDNSLPPYAYTSLCKDPSYAPKKKPSANGMDILADREAGMSVKEICEKYGLCKNTVYNKLSKARLKKGSLLEKPALEKTEWPEWEEWEILNRKYGRK